MATDPTGHWPKWVDKGVKAVKKVAKKAIKVVKNAGKALINGAKQIGTKVAQTIYDGAKGVKRTFQAGVNTVKSTINKGKTYVVTKAKQFQKSATKTYTQVKKNIGEAVKYVRNGVSYATKQAYETVVQAQEAVVQLAGNVNWDKVGTGAMIALGGIALTVAIVCTAGAAAAIPLFVPCLTAIGLSATASTAVLTTGVAAMGATALFYSGSMAIEGAHTTGYGLAGSDKNGYNPMRDGLFGENQELYDTVGMVATAGFMHASSTGQGYSVPTKPNNVQNYSKQLVGNTGYGNTRVSSEFGKAKFNVFNADVNKNTNINNSAGVSSEVNKFRKASLRDIKRQVDIPMSQQPIKQEMVVLRDANGKRILNKNNQPLISRELTYEINGEKIVIQDHSAGHDFGEIGDQSSHHNVRPFENTDTGKVPGMDKHYYFNKRNKK